MSTPRRRHWSAKPKTLRRLVETALIDAYDIGHAHGGNPLRMMEGKPPRRDADGWGPIADRLLRSVRRRGAK